MVSAIVSLVFSKINVFFSSSDKTKINCYNQRAHRLNKPHRKLSKHTPWLWISAEFYGDAKRALAYCPGSSWVLVSSICPSGGWAPGHQGGAGLGKWSLLPANLAPAPAHSLAQRPGFHAPCCPWCHFLAQFKKQRSPVIVPFSPPQAHKKPALTRVSLTIDAQLPRKWDNGRAALDRHSSSFLSREIKNCAQRQNDSLF